MNRTGSRVRRRGGLGRTASVILRSLSPVILGPAGWVVGHMSIYVAFPAVPLGGALLTVISVGILIGFGVYLAWLNHARSVATRRVGLAVALGGALLGAWLGFFVVAGPLALVTAIAGSGIGTNLTLLILDITSRTSGHTRT